MSGTADAARPRRLGSTLQALEHPADRAPSPADRVTSPAARVTSPAARVGSPAGRAPSPADRVASPADREASPADRVASPADRVASPADRVGPQDRIEIEIESEIERAHTATTAEAAFGEIGSVEVGVWEMSPGTIMDTEVDEIFVVLSGRAVVRYPATGEVLELGPGDAVRLYAGEVTEWTVTETLRKLYVAPAG